MELPHLTVDNVFKGNDQGVYSVMHYRLLFAYRLSEHVFQLCVLVRKQLEYHANVPATE